MTLTLNGRYVLQTLRHYRHHPRLRDSSDRLIRAAWRQYLAWLRGSIDDPTCDDDVVDWLHQIISEKVNNPRSTFYIYG